VVAKVMRASRPAADATLTSKGQVTVPASIRTAMGIKSGDKLHFTPTDAEAYLITPVRRGDLLDLAGIFADAGKRVGNLSIREMRRRTAIAREKRMRSAR
jgi:AbrB family looped-hinge helix DNA binding protein